jgi:hypothetical protein
MINNQEKCKTKEIVKTIQENKKLLVIAVTMIVTGIIILMMGV